MAGGDRRSRPAACVKMMWKKLIYFRLTVSRFSAAPLLGFVFFPYRLLTLTHRLTYMRPGCVHCPFLIVHIPKIHPLSCPQCVHGLIHPLIQYKFRADHSRVSGPIGVQYILDHRLMCNRLNKRLIWILHRALCAQTETVCGSTSLVHFPSITASQRRKKWAARVKTANPTVVCCVAVKICIRINSTK